MCAHHSTRFQPSDGKAPVLQAGDAQVVPLEGVVGNIDLPRLHFP
jgi:hypothetical protein